MPHFPLATIHGPWGPVNVTVESADIATDDFEDDDGFFVYNRGTTEATYTVRPLGNDGTTNRGDIDITAAAGGWGMLGNCLQPCKIVRSNSTHSSVYIGYPVEKTDPPTT